MKISVELPDTPNLIGLDPEFARTALVMVLHRSGKLSKTEACEFLGISLDSFDALLPRFGFSGEHDGENTKPRLSAKPVRVPHPAIAGKGKTLGDLTAPLVDEGDWDCLR